MQNVDLEVKKKKKTVYQESMKGRKMLAKWKKDVRDRRGEIAW